ncbi:hypothetical protein Baya_9708 [Bagarius yarrelli]|uniref:Uncharacterized protein n=1 Tax=Bagarius yarrelli TaxID=175774 RepID=A0A556UFI7_BAGYA|nr:hypothetical protein Baya_9708 [Bagarius yarrelli]
MGSKVSTGKMAAASRVVQMCDPMHLLLNVQIGSPCQPNLHDALKMLLGNTQSTPAPVAAPTPVQPTTPPPKPAGPVSRLPGTPDNINAVKELPQRYRRRPLALEEMDYMPVQLLGQLSVFAVPTSLELKG